MLIFRVVMTTRAQTPPISMPGAGGGGGGGTPPDGLLKLGLPELGGGGGG